MELHAPIDMAIPAWGIFIAMITLVIKTFQNESKIDLLTKDFDDFKQEYHRDRKQIMEFFMYYKKQFRNEEL